jgi:hypothetical protein
VKNTVTGQSVQAVAVDFCKPSSSNNLADVSQAVIDSLWPGYINGDLVNGYPLYADIEYTGQFVPGMDFSSGGVFKESADVDVSARNSAEVVKAPVEDVPARAKVLAAPIGAVDSSVAENPFYVEVTPTSKNPAASDASVRSTESSGSRTCVVSTLVTLLLLLLC